MSEIMIEQLKKDVEIPYIMQDSVKEAFAKIREEEKTKEHEKKRTGKSLYRMAASVALGIFALSAVTVSAAAYLKWSKGLEQELKVEEADKSWIEETGLSDFVAQSVTSGGVTITAEQSIVDNYYAYLSFKIEGYPEEIAGQPAFGNVEITVDGIDEPVSTNYSFYNGTIMDLTGKAVMADGSPLPVNEKGEVEASYVMEDGSLECHFYMTMADGPESFFVGKAGQFLDKKIHVNISGLGYSGDEEAFEEAVDGKWSFEWTLQGSDEMRMTDGAFPLGVGNIHVKRVELSPISVMFILDGLNMNEGAKAPAPSLPRFAGFKLKDGTIYNGTEFGMGGGRFVDNGEYQYMTSITRILKVDEVESLLFQKNVKSEGEVPTIEDYYEVKLP